MSALCFTTAIGILQSDFLFLAVRIFYFISQVNVFETETLPFIPCGFQNSFNTGVFSKLFNTSQNWILDLKEVLVRGNVLRNI